MRSQETAGETPVPDVSLVVLASPDAIGACDVDGECG